jgi:hypothetical protein
MGAFSPVHWLILLIEIALFVAGLIAGARILRRLGFSPWWILLGFVPIANVVGLWVLSQAPWPDVDKRSTI